MAQGQTALEAADAAARPLRAVLEDVWLTLDSTIEGEGRWLELYRGVPADPVFVCVDAMANVLHVRFDRDEGSTASLTLSYLPGWCYEAATAAHADRRPDPPTTLVTDLDPAVPMVFELTVEHPIAGADRTVMVGGEPVAYRPLPFGYAFTPARGLTIEEADPHSTPLVHWSAMRLRVAMAPGVAYTGRPLLGSAALTALRAVYIPGDGPTTCNQALALEVERHRHPGTLPGLGEPLRTVPAAEPDLVAGALAMRAAVGGDGGDAQAVAIEQARPDGVDLLLMKPDPRSPPRAQPWSWQPAWFVTAATFLDDVLFSMAKDVYDTYVEYLGGVPDSAPLPIRIRVDPESGEDRFAYRLDHLDEDGAPTAEPAPAEPGRPAFRLTVMYTPGVRVYLDKLYAELGESDLEGILQYHALRVDHFDDVPLEITDEVFVPGATLPDRPGTLSDLLQVIHTVGQFVPVPVIEAMYDLEDLGNVGAYVLTGKDLYGEPMSGLAAALTLGGVLLPEVIERVAGTVLAAGRRVLTRGDTPLHRLLGAASAAEKVDADFAVALVEDLPKELQ